MYLPGIIRFKEAYVDRIWGGTRLRSVLGKPTPADRTIGEAWLISDHESHESVVAEGPLAGSILRRLLETGARAVLGARASLTVHGRFPLLLKLLDSAQPLSVQVHPGDEDAARLGEPDVGKTEMWHVLEAGADGELICGLDPSVTAEAFGAAIPDGSVERMMTRFVAPPGTSVFVPAGTVHAIGGGMLLAEIQQNSDLTYRIYDWGRVDDRGRPRELHVDKALAVTRFGSAHAGPARPLSCATDGLERTIHAACRYFAAERLRVEGAAQRSTRGDSFHILLGVSGKMRVTAGETQADIKMGEAVLIPGVETDFSLEGGGEVLDYYVPDLEQDIVRPLLEAGHSRAAILRLGGAEDTSDLNAVT